MKWGHNYSFAISLLITGCIGIDNEAEKAKQELMKLQAEQKAKEEAQQQSAGAGTGAPASTGNATTPTAAAPATQNATSTTKPTTATPQDIQSYVVGLKHSSLLRTHFLDYALSFKTISDKNAAMTKENLAVEIEGLPSWSKFNWKTEEGNKIDGAPPDNSTILIAEKPKSNPGDTVFPTELRTDGSHVVHNLRISETGGLYVSEKTSLSAEAVTLEKDTWMEMRGKAVFSELHMKSGSILDIAQGQGLVLAGEKNPEDLEVGATKAVGEAPNKKGQLTFREGHNTQIDNAYLTTQQILHEGGNVHVSNARIFLQDEKDGSGGADATYIFRDGKIMPIEKPDAKTPAEKYDDVALRIYGKFSGEANSQLQINLFNGNKVATKYEFHMEDKKKEHRENVEKREITNNDRFRIGGIIILPSSGGIPTTGRNPIKLITSNIGLGSYNRQEANNKLAAASKQIAGKTLRIVSYSNTNEGGAPPIPNAQGSQITLEQDSQKNYIDDRSLYLEVTESQALFSASIVGIEAFNTFADDTQSASFPITNKTFIFANNLQHCIEQENKTHSQKIGFQHLMELSKTTQLGLGFSYAEFYIDNPVVRCLPKELSHFFGMNQSLTLTHKLNNFHFSGGIQNISVTENAHDAIPYSMQTTTGIAFQKDYSPYGKSKQQIKIGNKTYIHSLGKAVFNGRICNKWFASFKLKNGPASFIFETENLETDYYKLSLAIGMSL